MNIDTSEIKKLLNWKEEFDFDLSLADKQIEKSQELIKNLKEFKGEIKTVVGIDIYKYSKMPHEQQLIIPLILDQMLVGTSNLLGNDKYIFQNTDPKEIVSNRIDTGDGCFMIFDTPLHAIFFVLIFEVCIRHYNAYSLLKTAFSITEDIVYRIAISTDEVYSLDLLNNKTNTYGPGIIRCARMLKKDKLNRFLIDKKTYLWFSRNIKGIENLPLIDLNIIKNIKDFEAYNHKLISKDNLLFNTVNSLNKDDGIR